MQPRHGDVLILIPDFLSEIAWKCSRYGCCSFAYSEVLLRDSSDMLQAWRHSDTYSDSFKLQSKYDPDLDVVLSLIQITVQIRSRFGCHSVTHSNYSPDTIQIRMSFCHSFKLQIQFRYAPDTEAILILIQIQHS